MTTQEPAIGKSYSVGQPNDASHLQQQGDFSFMNHQVEEHFHVNQDPIAHNTRSKRRAIEDDIPPPPNQASTSNAISHVEIGK